MPLNEKGFELLVVQNYFSRRGGYGCLLWLGSVPHTAYCIAVRDEEADEPDDDTPYRPDGVPALRVVV